MNWRQRDMDLALRFQEPGNGCNPALPIRSFKLELLPACARERVKPGAARILGLAPLGIEPSCTLQTLQRGQERAGVDLKHAAGDLLDPPGDAEAVHGLQAQGFENQHIEGALNDVSVGCGHRLLDYCNSSWLSRYGGQEERTTKDTKETNNKTKNKPLPQRTQRRTEGRVI